MASNVLRTLSSTRKSLNAQVLAAVTADVFAADSTVRDTLLQHLNVDSVRRRVCECTRF